MEEVQEDVQEPPQAVRCGGENGEDGEAGGAQKQRLNVDMPGSSSSGRGRGKVAPAGHFNSKNLESNLFVVFAWLVTQNALRRIKNVR